MTLYSGDRIFLRGLTAECVIGFIDWERRVKQTVVVDLELPVDCRQAAVSDDVTDTVDYKKVSKRVLAFIEVTETPGCVVGAERAGENTPSNVRVMTLG